MTTHVQQNPWLAATPIALALAKVYGYHTPPKACKYHINALGQTCLDVTGLPITAYFRVEGTNASH